MLLTKINVQNYRLLVNAWMDVDSSMTLIVGRNNTAKTSCMDIIEKVLNGHPLSYDDYPLSKRQELFDLFTSFMKKDISYDELNEKLQFTSVELTIDYSLDDPNSNLGALSPFIIDVDVDTTSALIKAEYGLKLDENSLYELFEDAFYTEGKFLPNLEETRDICNSSFSKIFGLTIYAINPKNYSDTQIKTQGELSELFPFFSIPAERILGEDGAQNNSSLSALITNYFSVNVDELNSDVATEIKNLRKIVEEANKTVQKHSNELLSSVVNKAVGFGYPNAEELQLGVSTKLRIDEQIMDHTKLTYTSNVVGETLPSSHNGLGYKNLIKMEFLLADYAQRIGQGNNVCIPLLFIEEPESHMHPQMQHAFAEYLETFLQAITDVHIQTFLTSHSAHIANTIDFSKIRYAQKTTTGVEYKNLHTFAQDNPTNMDFIKKYLTLSRCDLFFADKIIFIEGASERLLLPDMIEKCEKEGLFNSQKYKLPAQYYALIEIGGAYAYKFIPFVNFLGIPCLILTDIDSMIDGRTKSVVSKGKTTSNVTIKWWMRKLKNISEKDKISLTDIIALKDDEKTMDKCHLEFQTEEQGLCGRSLEEAIRNVNRTHYGLSATPSEAEIEFDEKSKTDFALKLIYDNPNYTIPQYIKNGLMWLNDQKVLM
nr:AAA family ATPase [uncultured Ruminococcus sp.]